MENINIVYLLSALLFGVVHSIEPGHGKGLVTTLVLSNKKNKVIDIITIGVLATITHTLVIFFIAFIGFKFLGFVAPENKEIIARIIASVIILGIGVWLLWDKIFHSIVHDHKHGEECCIHDKLTKGVKTTSIFAIGIISGSVPCSGGLAIVMAAIATGEFKSMLNSFFYIFSFSLGLGLSLVIVGISVIYGKSLITSFFEKSVKNIEKCSAALSSILIYSLGLVLLTYNAGLIIGTKIEDKLHNLHHHESPSEHHQHQHHHHDHDKKFFKPAN